MSNAAAQTAGQDRENTMRFDGTLKSWNADRGFGFITPRTGGQDIFIHISAFPRDGSTPREGEVLSFEVESTPEGKKRAVRVQRPGAATATHGSGPREAGGHRSDRRGSGLGGGLIALVLVGVLGWYGYGEYQRRLAPRSQPVGTVPAAPDVLSSGNFRCDGRTHCSQMTSCAEATFFLRNCPGVKMDGNNDGVPCEQQWCTSPTAQ
jgi:cold shock CspA family protein